MHPVNGSSTWETRWDFRHTVKRLYEYFGVDTTIPDINYE
jgi:hypothetical protein